MQEIGLGILGFGTVGAGVVDGLQRHGDAIARRLGRRLVVRRIADLDTERDRGVSVPPGSLCRDASSVIADDGIDVVIELIGGTGVAGDLVGAALRRGKPVVTANKALLAERGREIFGLAEEHNVDIYFGASVGGGIPIIRALREGLIGNRIESIYGILNGTCNYILTRMESAEMPFAEALAEAQAKGFAEADPGLDIDGFDTAHKAVILASLACGAIVPMERVFVEGIRDLSEADIRNALDLGYRIKLLAVIRATSGMAEASAAPVVEIRVHPTLVPLNHMLASVSGVFNAVMVQGDLAGETLYYGRGAGREPTASTVIADVVDVARNLVGGCPRRVPAVARSSLCAGTLDMAEIDCRYYLRLLLLDEPGVLGRITTVLGTHGISLASVVQKEAGVGEHVPVVMVTHEANEGNVTKALTEIDAMDIVAARTIKLRIADHG